MSVCVCVTFFLILLGKLEFFSSIFFLFVGRLWPSDGDDEDDNDGDDSDNVGVSFYEL